MLSNGDIESRFGFHKATIEGKNATVLRHSQLRAAFKAWAAELNKTLPEGRYKELCLTELESTSMWAHKSVAETAPVEHEEVLDNQERRHV